MVIGFCIGWSGYGVGRRTRRVVVRRGEESSVEDVQFWSLARELSRGGRANELRELVETRREDLPGVYEEMRLHMMVIQTYIKRKNIDGALRHFEDMKLNGLRPDVIVYNVLLAALAKVRRLRKVFELSREMELYYVPADAFTYAALIDAYASVGNVKMAWRIYDRMQKKNIQPNRVTFGALVTASARKGDVKGAQKAFRHMRSYRMKPSKHIYNAIITASAKKGEISTAIQTFIDMQRANVSPDVVTFTALLSAYAAVADLQGVLTTFREFTLRNLSPDAVIYAELIRAHARLGDIQDAINCFQEMQNVHHIEPDLIIYSTMIDAYGRHKMLPEAEQMFDAMLTAGIRANDVVFNTLIDVHTKNMDYDGAILAFRRMEESQIRPNQWTFTTLIHAYTKKMDMDRAERTMVRMKEMNVPPLVATYTTLIDGFANVGNLRKAHWYYTQLKQNKKLRLVARAYNSIMRAYAKFGLYKRVRRQFADLRRRGVKPDTYTYSVLIDVYAMEGELMQVELAYRDMIERSKIEPDEVVVCSRLRAYIGNGKLEMARRLFEEMGTSKTRAVFEEMITAHLEVEDVKRVVEYCHEMRANGFGNDVSMHNALIRAMVLVDDCVGCLERFREMVNARVRVDAKTIDLLLYQAGWTLNEFFAELKPGGIDERVCGEVMRVSCRRERWEDVVTTDLTRASLGVKRSFEAFQALIMAYDRSGSIENVLELFREMRTGGSLVNVFTFNHVIEACGHADDLTNALSTYKLMKMDSIEPNLGTFNAIMTVYARRKCPEAILAVMDEASKLGIAVDVNSYNRLLDSYVRQGELSRAIGVMEIMERHNIQPDVHTFQQLIVAHVAVNRWDTATVFFVEMKRRSILPNPSCYALLHRILSSQLEYGSGDKMLEISRMLREHGLHPDPQVYELLLQVAIDAQQLDLASQVVEEIRFNAVPLTEAAKLLIAKNHGALKQMVGGMEKGGGEGKTVDDKLA